MNKRYKRAIRLELEEENNYVIVSADNVISLSYGYVDVDCYAVDIVIKDNKLYIPSLYLDEAQFHRLLHICGMDDYTIFRSIDRSNAE